MQRWGRVSNDAPSELKGLRAKQEHLFAVSGRGGGLDHGPPSLPRSDDGNQPFSGTAAAKAERATLYGLVLQRRETVRGTAMNSGVEGTAMTWHPLPAARAQGPGDSRTSACRMRTCGTRLHSSGPPLCCVRSAPHRNACLRASPQRVPWGNGVRRVASSWRPLLGVLIRTNRLDGYILTRPQIRRRRQHRVDIRCAQPGHAGHRVEAGRAEAGT